MVTSVTSVSGDLPDLPDEGVEHVVHVSPVGGARLIERTVELLSQSLALSHVHRSVGLLEVHLVGHEHHGDVLRGPDFSYKIPILYGLVKAVPASDVSTW